MIYSHYHDKSTHNRINSSNNRSKISRNQLSGATAVEASISLLVLLTILLLTIELSQYLYTSLGLQYAVGDTGRWASLGKQLSDDKTSTTLSREQSIQKMLQTNAKTFSLQNFDKASINICPTSLSCTSSNNAGGPNDTVQLTVNLPYKFLLWKKTDTITASVIFRNEPYA